MADTRINSAAFGDFHYQQFVKWSFGERTSKSGLLRNLACARTEANLDLIDRQFAFYCERYKLTAEQLWQRLEEADRTGLSIPKLHRLLSAEAGLGDSDDEEEDPSPPPPRTGGKLKRGRAPKSKADAE